MVMRMARVAPEKTDHSARPAIVLFAESFGESEMKLTYSEQLKHPNWQKLRLEVLSRAGFKCEVCGDDETTLHVHHKQYIKGRMAWEYEKSNFSVLCEVCHEEVHAKKSLISNLLAALPEQAMQDAADLLIGWGEIYFGNAYEGHVNSPGLYISGRLASIAEDVLDIYLLQELFDQFNTYESSENGINFHVPKQFKTRKCGFTE